MSHPVIMHEGEPLVLLDFEGELGVLAARGIMRDSFEGSISLQPDGLFVRVQHGTRSVRCDAKGTDYTKLLADAIEGCEDRFPDEFWQALKAPLET